MQRDDRSNRLLVMSADERTLAFLVDNLTADGFTVHAAASEGAAEKLLRSEFLSLAVLDIDRPDHAGLQLLERVRRSDPLLGAVSPELLMLVMSRSATELDRLRAFDRGCDDFLAKPFSYKELRARIHALLRRAGGTRSAGRVRVGPLVVEAASRAAWIHGEPVALSNKEFSLLRTLAAEPTRAFTREELLRDVWGHRSYIPTRTIDSHASRLRHKLGAHGDKFVINVWGVGYRLLDAVPGEMWGAEAAA